MLRPMVLGAAAVLSLAAEAAENAPAAVTLRDSLVYVNVSSNPYDQYRPWERGKLVRKAANGCAVGPYEVLTTAATVTDATVIRVRRYGQNDFLPARVTVRDYASNLCLLELDREAAGAPLTPLVFAEEYGKGSAADFYWLSDDGRIETSRGYVEDARMELSNLSFARSLQYLVSNLSRAVGDGQLCMIGGQPAGFVGSSGGQGQQARVITAPVIAHFLEDAADGDYAGFPGVGFVAEKLLDPTFRAYLSLPTEETGGVYVKDVFTVGTGADVLKGGDVLLAIDGVGIDAHGRIEHPVYDQLVYRYLIKRKRAGETIRCAVWRDGARVDIEAAARPIDTYAMLVPYHEYDRQPEYVIAGGFVFQKLTRPYLQVWGNRAASQLTEYERSRAFKPSAERRDIVILSYVIPAPVNLGYQNLYQLVVTSYNGKPVTSIEDIQEARKLRPDAPWDIVEFEYANPTVVIPRAGLAAADAMLARAYGIEKLVHVE